MHIEVFFDVETKKLFSEIEGDNPGDLGISIVSIYHRKLNQNYKEDSGELISFWGTDFERMWKIFQEADRVIGFNSVGFDVPALTPYAKFPFAKLAHFDIMQKVKEKFGRRIGLDAIAKESLDREKTDTGLNAVYYWNKGDSESLAKLQKYCEEDVIITRDIYDFVLANGYLLFKDKWNTQRKVDLDFSY